MNTDDLYERFIFYTRKYSFDLLADTSLPNEIKGILAVMGLPEVNVQGVHTFDPNILAFRPQRIYEQIEMENKFYYKMGDLRLLNTYRRVYIDTAQWHIWTVKEELLFLNSDLSSFLLFINTYAYSLIPHFAKEATREQLEKQYVQLKTQFESIDSRALLNEDNMWSGLLAEIKRRYESYG